MMKTLTRSALLVLCLAGSALAAIDANTVWEVRTAGSQSNGGGFRWKSLVYSSYKWTLSGSGTNEYYLEAAAGGDPGITGSGSVTCDGRFRLSSAGVLGSLAAGEHAYGDNDALGYTTLYVRLANGLDPDAMIQRGGVNYVLYGAGGTDYSQQDANELTLTDIATDGAGTGLSSVIGGFTAGMVHNIIHLTGGGATAGWYEITAVTDANACTIDRSAGATKTNVTGTVGGAFQVGGTVSHEWFQSHVSGNRVWVKAGTYTLGENTTMIAGVRRITGYVSARGDACMANDRPLIDCGTYYFMPYGYTYVDSLRFTGTGTYVIFTQSAQNNTVWGNLKVTNTSAGNTKSALYAQGGYGIMMGCEASAAGTGGSYAFYIGNNSTVIGCYAHDSLMGFNPWAAGYTYFSGCIAADCTTGITSGSTCLGGVINCGFYNCTKGISIAGALSNAMVIANNAFESCTYDVWIDQATAQANLWSFYNCFGGTTPLTSVRDGSGNIFGVPGFADPNNADFRVDQSDPNVYEQGIDAGFFTPARTY